MTPEESKEAIIPFIYHPATSRKLSTRTWRSASRVSRCGREMPSQLQGIRLGSLQPDRRRPHRHSVIHFKTDRLIPPVMNGSPIVFRSTGPNRHASHISKSPHQLSRHTQAILRFLGTLDDPCATRKLRSNRVRGGYSSRRGCPRPASRSVPACYYPGGSDSYSVTEHGPIPSSR